MSEFDELLDQVLSEDARVEPRQGFEQRILAGLRAETARRRGLWMWWVPAGLCVGLVLGMVLIVQHGLGWPDSSVGLHSAAGKLGGPLAGEKGGGEASLPTPQKVRKVLETDTLSMVHHSGPPLLPRAVAGRRMVSEVRQGEEVGESRLPKMETFPAVAQSGGFLPEPVMTSGEGGKLREVLDSPQVAQALLELKAEQERPLEVSAIEIEPL